MEDLSFEELLATAESHAGRKLDVDRTKDGKFIVLYMCFGRPPPPKGVTREEALQLFIGYMENGKPLMPGAEEDYKELKKMLSEEEEDPIESGN
jgi:hypothetical protein